MGLFCLTLLYFSNTTFGGWLVATVLGWLSAVAAGELCSIIKKTGVLLEQKTVANFTGMMPVFFFIATLFPTYRFLPYAALFFFSCYLCLQQFKRVSGSVNTIASEIFCLIYIGIPIGLFFSILHFDGQDGRIWALYLILVTKCTDIGAYFVGKLFGKRRLAPTLSPKKSWEGGIAGVISAVAVSLCFSFIGSAFFARAFTLSWPKAVILGVLIAIFGMFGDLVESLFKRDAEVKDSGIIPGMGGILDMVDSLLFTTPLLYFFTQL